MSHSAAITSDGSLSVPASAAALRQLPEVAIAAVSCSEQTGRLHSAHTAGGRSAVAGLNHGWAAPVDRSSARRQPTVNGFRLLGARI